MVLRALWCYISIFYFFIFVCVLCAVLCWAVLSKFVYKKKSSLSERAVFFFNNTERYWACFLCVYIAVAGSFLTFHINGIFDIRATNIEKLFYYRMRQPNMLCIQVCAIVLNDLSQLLHCKYSVNFGLIELSVKFLFYLTN